MKKLLPLAAAVIGFAVAAPDATAAAKPKVKAKKKAAPVAQAADDQFTKLDTNSDGKLSLDEFKPAVPAPAKVSKKNPAPDAERLFNQLDANNDKFLSAEEFKNYKPAVAEPKKKKDK